MDDYNTTVALVWRGKRVWRMTRLSKLERVYAHLELGRHLLKSVNGQLISHSQPVLEMPIMDAAMSDPAACRLPTFAISIRSKPTAWSDEAERRKSRQPIKPLSRIRKQAQFAFLCTDDHICSQSAVFDQRRHTRSGSLFCLDQRTCGREQSHTLNGGLLL